MANSTRRSQEDREKLERDRDGIRQRLQALEQRVGSLEKLRDNGQMKRLGEILGNLRAEEFPNGLAMRVKK